MGTTIKVERSSNMDTKRLDDDDDDYDNLASFDDHRGLGVTTLGMNVSSFMAATRASWHHEFQQVRDGAWQIL